MLHHQIKSNAPLQFKNVEPQLDDPKPDNLVTTDKWATKWTLNDEFKNEEPASSFNHEVASFYSVQLVPAPVKSRQLDPLSSRRQFSQLPRFYECGERSIALFFYLFLFFRIASVNWTRMNSLMSWISGQPGKHLTTKWMETVARNQTRQDLLPFPLPR